MADHKKYPSNSIFLLFLASIIFSSYAYQFKVGGRHGWVVNPYENYNHWAGKMRFQVNDTLFFKYKKGSNSVLVVNKDDYDKCNFDKPIRKFEDGNSIFKFDRSGPFFFISGNKTNCDQGQKLVIVVLAVRTPPKPPAISPISPPSSAPTPAGSPPSVTPSPLPITSVPPSSNPPVSPPPGGIAPVPSNSTPAGGNSPPPRSSARPTFATPSVVSVLALCVTSGASLISL